MINHALIFIKPHASGSEPFRELVQQKLDAAGVSIKQTGIITGKQVEERGIADLHYLAISRAAINTPASELHLCQDAKKTFRKTFAKNWDKVTKLNAFEYQNLYKSSSEELYADVRKSKNCKLAPGTYIAEIKEKKAFVINGFYPAMRDKFTAANARFIWYDTEFEPNKLSWKDLRSKVIGATNPEKAVPQSIRGTLFRDYKILDLPAPPTMQDNGVHAGAGPLEGARERLIWLGITAEKSPFLSECKTQLSLNDSTIANILENPEVTYNNTTEPLFDFLEDMNSLPAMHRLGEILTELKHSKKTEIC